MAGSDSAAEGDRVLPDSATRTARGRVLERTADGHHVVIDGRRWRATDPAIPETDAALLRRWLAAARRDVGTAKRRSDANADQADQAAARARVHAAKTALGERGPAWWDQTDDERRSRWQAGLEQAAAEGVTPE